MKRSIGIILSVLTVAALAAVPVEARPHRARGALALLAHAKAELGLSEAQTNDIRAIMRALREQNAQYRDQLRAGRADVIDTLIADPRNIGAAQSLMDRREGAERAIKANALNATARALSVLTREQRTKLASMLERRRERRAERRDRSRD